MDSAVQAVTKQVHDALLNDPRTKGSIIEVAYNQGIVTLTGKVKSAAEQQAASEIARAQPGVIAVTNEIKVG